MTDFQSFHEVVKTLKTKGLIKNLKHLSDLIGYNYTYLSQINSGSSPPTIELIDAINRVFGLIYVLRLPPELRQIDITDYMEVPYIPIENQRTYIDTIFNNTLNFTELNTMLVSKQSESGNYKLFETNGDAMDDGTNRAICLGDKLFCVQLDKLHWPEKMYYKQYLFVIVSQQGIICRQIINHKKDAESIVCHAFNLKFEDFEMPLNEVFELYYVLKIHDRQPKF